MFFTKVGEVVARLAFIFGILRVITGIIFAQAENYEALARMYLGSKNTGEAIDKGFTMILFGIALGIATEISRSLRRDS